jgi:hypothetical protein
MPSLFISFTISCTINSFECIGVKLGLLLLMNGKGCRLSRKEYRGEDSHLGERMYGGRFVTMTEMNTYTFEVCRARWYKKANNSSCAKTFIVLQHLISSTLSSKIYHIEHLLLVP